MYIADAHVQTHTTRGPEYPQGGGVGEWVTLGTGKGPVSGHLPTLAFIFVLPGAPDVTSGSSCPQVPCVLRSSSFISVVFLIPT